MDLFSPGAPTTNLLPRDGEAFYHGPVISGSDTERYFQRLSETIDWQHDEVVLFGRRIVTARQVAWHGDQDFAYTYSGNTRLAQPWTTELLELRDRVRSILAEPFDACLLNFYLDGSQGMSWHSDDEKDLAPGASIASLSFGAERKFAFKHRRVPELKTSLILENGSLLVMSGETQTHWLHALPKSKRVTRPRINLTFRVMAEAGTASR